MNARRGQHPRSQTPRAPARVGRAQAQARHGVDGHPARLCGVTARVHPWPAHGDRPLLTTPHGQFSRVVVAGETQGQPLPHLVPLGCSRPIVPSGHRGVLSTTHGWAERTCTPRSKTPKTPGTRSAWSRVLGVLGVLGAPSRVGQVLDRAAVTRAALVPLLRWSRLLAAAGHAPVPCTRWPRQCPTPAPVAGWSRRGH